MFHIWLYISEIKGQKQIIDKVLMINFWSTWVDFSEQKETMPNIAFY